MIHPMIFTRTRRCAVCGAGADRAGGGGASQGDGEEDPQGGQPVRHAEGGLRRCARRFHPLLSILTEIYLCHTCSCHEIISTGGNACTGANLYIYKLDKNNEKLAKPNRTQVLSKIEAISVDTIKVSECAQLHHSPAHDDTAD
eukprot:COSAG01_NODE_8668_length_2703_cov_4.591398_4_plen_143_part_00